MSKNYNCKRKKSYSTISALREAGKRLSEYYCGLVEVHGYFCMHCGKYHLTTSSFTKSRKYNDRIF